MKVIEPYDPFTDASYDLPPLVSDGAADVQNVLLAIEPSAHKGPWAWLRRRGWFGLSWGTALLIISGLYWYRYATEPALDPHALAITQWAIAMSLISIPWFIMGALGLMGRNNSRGKLTPGEAEEFGQALDAWAETNRRIYIRRGH